MKIAVRYFSRSGNTEKVAQAIAQAVGAQCGDCSEPIDEALDLLFLGGSTYGGGVDAQLRQFVEELNPAYVKRAAVFGTSALKKEPEGEISALLRGKGIAVSDGSFHCRGAFALLHRKRPNDMDLSQAAEFARLQTKNIKNTKRKV